MDLNNIFGDEESKKKSSKNTSIKKASTGGLNDIFASSPKVNMDYKPPVKEEVKKAPTFIDTALDKTATVVSKVATSVGNWLAEQNKQNEIASLGMRDIMQGKVKSVVDPVTGKKTISSQYSDAYKLAKTPEEQAKVLADSQKDIPLIKMLNSETGQKVTGAISSNTSNIPLKLYARVKSLGDDTYDEAYSAALAKSKDPNNSRLEKILYGVQDSGIQSAIGALLAVGTSVLTKNANTGRAVSLPFFAAISAEGQRQEKGEVNNIGNIAIDTVGDQVLSGFAESALKSFAKEGAEQTAKEFAKKLGTGFAVEGSTENAQTFLKYGNDYRNAFTDEEKQKVVKDLTEYVKSGAMVNEFLIGGIAGAGITGVASGVGSQMQNKGEIAPEMTDSETKQARQAVAELSVDFSELRDELLSYQKEADYNDNVVNRVDILQDQLNDFQQAFKDRAVYISDENQATPLATIETIKYPDGKYAFSFSADTQQNSLISPFDNSKLFKTKEEAIKEAKKTVLDWLDTQAINADSTEMKKIDEIRTEIKNVGVKESEKRIEELKISKDMIMENKGFRAMSVEAQEEYLTRNTGASSLAFVEKYISDGKDFNADTDAGKKVRRILEDVDGQEYFDDTVEKITNYFDTKRKTRADNAEDNRKIKDINKKIRQIKNGEWLIELAKKFNSASAFADQFKGENNSKNLVKLNDYVEDKTGEASNLDPIKDREEIKNIFKEITANTEKTVENKGNLTPKFEDYGIYSLDEQAQKYDEFIKPQLEKIGDVGTDEIIIYYNGDGKNDQYVNTQLREVFTYPVDENLKVEKVQKSRLKTTGNEDKDAIGYRLLQEAKTEPVIENRNKREGEKQPVVTEGKVKNSKAFQRVQERLGEYADFDVNYNKLNLAKDTAKALEFIEKNPVDAKKIALGMQIAPEGVTETAISIALAEKASENKDYALQAQLERSRSLRQTRRGQEIVAERGRFNENSAHFFMQQVLKARIEQAGKVDFTSLFRRSKSEKPTGFESKLREGTENIKKTVKKKLSATDLAQNVIDSLTC